MLKKSYPYIKVFLFLIGVFSIPSIFIAGFYEDQIVDKAIETLNGSIQGKISYKEADINLISNFPHVDVVLGQPNLTLHEDTLMRGQHMSIQLDLISILTGAYTIHGIDLLDCSVSITQDRKGELSLSAFFGSNRDEKSDEQTDLTISNISLKNVVVHYFDSITHNRIKIIDTDGQINFSIRNQLLSSEVDLIEGKIAELIISNKRYSTGQKLTTQGSFNYGLKNKTLTINKGLDISVGKTRTTANGTIVFAKNILYDLKLESFHSELRNLYYQIPREYQQIFSKYIVPGSYSGIVYIKGESSHNKLPRIDLNGKVSIPQISLKDQSTLLENIESELNLQAGPDMNGASFYAQFSNFSTRSTYGTFKGNWSYSNLIKGILNAELSGNTDLKSLNTLLPKEITVEQGRSEIANLSIRDYEINGNASFLEHMELNCTIKESKLKAYSIPISINCPKVVIQSGQLKLSELAAESGVSDLNGTIIVNVLDRGWKIYTELFSKRLDLDEFIAYRKIEKARPVHSLPESTTELDVQWMHSIDHFTIRHVDYTKTNMDYAERNKAFTLDFYSELADGIIESSVSGHRKNGINAQAKIKLHEIDVATLFSEYDNFDQDFIQSEHIDGELDAFLIADLAWDKNYNFISKNTDITAYTTIREGNLTDFQPLSQFKKYISSDILSNVRFSQLSTFFTFSKDELFLPAIFIQNNACNFYLSGYQNLSGRIHYNMLINAEQALLRKLGRKQEGILPAHKSGWFNLYYNIDGTTTDFKYKRDKELVMNGFKHGEKIKSKLKEDLENEFPNLPIPRRADEWFETNSEEIGLEPATEGQIEYIRNF